jgi:hypothetical protein
MALYSTVQYKHLLGTTEWHYTVQYKHLPGTTEWHCTVQYKHLLGTTEWHYTVQYKHLLGTISTAGVIGRARIFLTATKHSYRKACHFATYSLFSTTATLHRPSVIADGQIFLLL